MSTLVIGGSGKTGSRLAGLLQAAGMSYLVTSRSGRQVAPHNDRWVRFDWYDESTYDVPFKAGHRIERLYIIIPDVLEPLPIVRNFLHLAKRKGVRRFVLLGASPPGMGENPHGKVHEFLAAMDGIEYAVLRPTWFSENFGTDFLEDIKDHDRVWSVAKDGRIPFVSAQDIAEVAFDALTSKTAWNTDKFVVGPQLFAYDDATNLLSEIIGRRIVHQRLSSAEEWQIWISMGNTEEYADWLVKIEEDIAKGSEERIFLSNKAIVGTRTLRDYFLENKDSWAPTGGTCQRLTEGATPLTG